MGCVERITITSTAAQKLGEKAIDAWTAHRNQLTDAKGHAVNATDRQMNVITGENGIRTNAQRDSLVIKLTTSIKKIWTHRDHFKPARVAETSGAQAVKDTMKAMLDQEYAGLTLDQAVLMHVIQRFGKKLFTKQEALNKFSGDANSKARILIEKIPVDDHDGG